MGFISLLGNRYVIIGIIVAAIVGGVWFKIHGLERERDKALVELAAVQSDNEILKGNVATLKQNLDMALSVNESNSKIVEEIQTDKRFADASLRKLATDLSTARRSIEDAKAKLAATTGPSVPVPPRIVEAATSIQDSRTVQATINKKAEEDSQ